MSAVKYEVLNLIKDLPDDVSIEAIMEELYFKVIVDKGLTELDADQGILHSVVKEKFTKILRTCPKKGQNLGAFNNVSHEKYSFGTSSK